MLTVEVCGTTTVARREVLIAAFLVNFPLLMIIWLVVWNMNFIFPFSWEFHNPN